MENVEALPEATLEESQEPPPGSQTRLSTYGKLDLKDMDFEETKPNRGNIIETQEMPLKVKKTNKTKLKSSR